MPLNNTSSRVWKPAKWKLTDMFGACERLALAAKTLAGRQVWRRPQLNDIAMCRVHEDGMDSLSVTDFMKLLCILAKGDVFIGAFSSAYCLILHCHHCRRDHFSHAKMPKNTRFQR